MIKQLMHLYPVASTSYSSSYVLYLRNFIFLNSEIYMYRYNDLKQRLVLNCAEVCLHHVGAVSLALSQRPVLNKGGYF